MNVFLYIQQVWQSSSVISIVMLSLVLLSVVSWSVIFFKVVHSWRTMRAMRAFTAQFTMYHGRWPALYQLIVQASYAHSVLSHLFCAGMAEAGKHLHIGAPELACVERVIDSAAQREVDRLSVGLGFLGTASSVSPYIGLLGTVLGIMSAVQKMVTLSMPVLFPAIAQALLATAMGLVVAIPSLVAYNYFLTWLENVKTHMHSFQSDFLSGWSHD